VFYDYFAHKSTDDTVTRVGKLNICRYHQKICHGICALRKSPAVVLEVGPGLGRFAEECMALKYTYLGIEFNTTLLRELALKYRMICSRVPPVPLRSESVHVIVADQVIEHMPTFRDSSDFLSECHRVLKPSGLLVLGFPDYARMPGLAFYDCDYSHSFLTTKNRVAQILKDTGFEPSRIIRFTGSVSSPLLRLLLDLMMLIIYAKPTFLMVDALGASEVIYRVRKTFVASTVVFAEKTGGKTKGVFRT
jgi:SAM-dependent methyltransferase